MNDNNLWRNRDFNIFWAGQAVSSLGDAFALIAVPLLVLEATGSVVQMGLVTATFSVGWLLVGLLAGPLVDRVDRRRLMMVADTGRFLAYGAIPLGWLLWGPSMTLIYLATLAGAMLGMSFQVAYTSSIPNLVDRDQVVAANGRLQMTWALSFVFGPMLAGIVSSQVGPMGAILINACSFLFSAAALLAVRLRPVAAAAQRPALRQTLLAGIVYLWRTPVLRAVTVIMAFVAMVLLASDDLFIYLLKSDLAQPDRGVGLFFGVATVGAILAGALAPRLRRRWGFGPTFLGGIAVEGVTMILIGLAPTLFWSAALAVLFKFAQHTRMIVMVSVRQEVTPGHLLGRVSAAFLVLASVPGPLGIAVTTGLAESMGARPVMLGMGAVALSMALIGAQTAARTRWPERAAVAVPAGGGLAAEV